MLHPFLHPRTKLSVNIFNIYITLHIYRSIPVRLQANIKYLNIPMKLQMYCSFYLKCSALTLTNNLCPTLDAASAVGRKQEADGGCWVTQVLCCVGTMSHVLDQHVETSFAEGERSQCPGAAGRGRRRTTFPPR